MSDDPARRGSGPGVLVVVSAPSGAGKTSLVERLVERHPEIQVSISHTTRPKRPAETAGEHYHFVDDATFQEMTEVGAFVEHARVFDHLYGTARANLLDKLAEGCDVILEIDWQGAQQVRHQLAGDAAAMVSVFILPPSLQALTERLAHRAQDDSAVIERRLAQAVTDMTHHAEFDHVLVNDDFESTVTELEDIIAAARTGDSSKRRPPDALIKRLLTAT